MVSHVTLAEFKDYLGINSTTYDARLSNLIVYASELVETYCSREFSNANVTEYHSGGRSSVFVSRLPVNNVWTLSEYDGTQYIPLVNPGSAGELPNVAANSNAAPGYSYITDTGQIFKGFDTAEPSIANQPIFNSYRNGIKIFYNGGYTTIPSDLKLVIIDIVKQLFKQLEGRSVRLEGESETRFPYSGGWPPHIRRTLDLYRQIV